MVCSKKHCYVLSPGYLPPPIHSSQLAQRLLQQQKYERLDEGGEVEEIEMELEENEPEQAAAETKEMVRQCESVCLCVYDLVLSLQEVTPSSPPRAPAPPSAPPTATSTTQGQTVIRHGYNPKASQAPPTQPAQQQQRQQAPSVNYLISPITGEKIPADKMEEHMRYGQSCWGLVSLVRT